MFLLKKLFSHMIYPVPLLMFAAAIILILALRQKKKTAIHWLTIFFIALFAALAYEPIPRLMVSNLERHYPKLDTVPHDAAAIVVLGGGSCSDHTLPLTSQLTESSLIRLTQGVSLFNQTDSIPLIVTGGAVLDTVTIAALQRRMAISLGVDSLRIFLADSALDTEMEAQQVKRMVQSNKVVLVTSAMHMPRAAALFRKAGLEPIPSPTHYEYPNSPITPGDFFPSGQNMQNATQAAHEYLGMIWSSIRGKM